MSLLAVHDVEVAVPLELSARGATDRIPLTPGQTERWLAANFDPNAGQALNESYCMVLTGPVKLPVLELAINEVLQRHDAFRMRMDADEPAQVLDAEVRPRVRRVDLSGEGDTDIALDSFCRRVVQRRFVIDQAPLAEFSLLILPDGSVAFHGLYSHLVCDGWSVKVLVSELVKVYRAREAGEVPKLRAAATPGSFGAALQARWHGPEGEASRAYWRDALRNPPAPLQLGDRTPGLARTYACSTLTTDIDATLLGALQLKAQEHGATLFHVLLAAMALAFQRRSGRDDFVIGIPFASQALVRGAPVVTDGAIDLPVRLRCQASDSLADVLAQVQARMAEAIKHPYVTQGSVAREVGVKSTGHRPPLTGILLNMLPRLNARTFEPLQARAYEGAKPFLLGELLFNFLQGSDSLTLHLHYSRDDFSPGRAAELADDLLTVLHEMAAAAVPATTATLAPIPTLVSTPTPSAADLEQIATWNATERPYESGLRLGDLLMRAVQQHPDAVAVRFEGRELTYRDLDAQAWSLAMRLREQGVGPGAMVGVCLERGAELVVALLASVYSGGAYVPLDPQQPPARLAGMCRDAAPVAIIAGAAELARLGPVLPAGVPVLQVEGAVPARPAGELIGGADDPAYAIFTSGSTGRPKGALNSHRAIVNRLQWMQEEYRLTPLDRVVQKTPCSFDVSVWEFFWPLMTGATLVVARPEGHRDPHYLLQLVRDEAVTVMHFVPSMLRAFLDEPLGEACRSLRQVVCSGEALPIDLVDRFFQALPQVSLDNLYGPTEAAVDVTCWNCVPHDARRIVPIGRPIANTRMHVLDAQLRPVAIGQEGELYIAGVQVGMGYLARPDLSAERFLPDPFHSGGRLYKTGDVGRWLADGAIEYLGRSDDQVKIRGHRIELGEIESQLSALASVARGVVVAHEFEPGDLRLVAYVVWRDGAVDPALLTAQLAQQLPDVMVPRHVVTVAGIPLLSNGKIDRKGLPAPWLEAPASTAAAALPAERVAALPAELLQSSPTRAAAQGIAQTIAQAMATVLKRPTVGADEDFFELGGHSLLAARLSARLSEVLGWRPGLRAIFEAPTPAALAQRMAADTAAAEPPEVSAIPHRADQSTAALSLMQQRVWFLENANPGTPIHVTPTAHLLKGDLNVPAFERAFQRLVERQSALRTVVERTPTGDRQRVLDGVAFSFSLVENIGRLPEPQRAEALQRRIAELVAAPFDLERGPLFRARLWRLGPQEHCFVFVPHHLIWDGWSFELLFSELAELYEACRDGRASTLAPLPVSYGDFADWQLDWVRGPELKRQVDHWVERLSPLPPALELPPDRPRPALMSGKGGLHRIVLDPGLTDTLLATARRHGTTPYVVLLSAYALMLHRMTAQADFVVGTPVRGREQPGLDSVMGFFVNMLPLRTRFDPSLSLHEWVAVTHGRVVDAFAHADVPFEQLMRRLNPPRDYSRAPIHQAFFSFQDLSEQSPRWSDLDIQHLDIDAGGATQDLALWCLLRREGLEFVFAFNADIMDESSVALIGQRLQSLLQQFTANAHRPVVAFDLLAPSERERLAAWNTTALPFDATDRVHDLIQRQAQRTPAAVALSQPGQTSLDCADLERRSNRLARHLRSRGIGRGALVGLCLERRPAMVVAQLAVLKAGAGYVPLDPAYPPARLAGMAHDARLALLLTDTASVSAIAWPAAQTLVLDREAAAIDAQDETPPPPSAELDASADDVAYVIYTSGSTGVPKGVSVPHRAVVNFLGSMAREPGLAAHDRLLAVTTLSFDISVLELLLPLTVGAQVVLAERHQALDGRALCELIQSSGATVMQATPGTWRLLLEAGWRGARGFKALVGGEPLPADLASTLLQQGVELWNLYGPTETTVWSSCWKVERPEDGIFIGRPIANTQIHILDDSGKPCPIGIVGELCIGGAGVALGYLYRPELTAERFIDDPFSERRRARLYRTGDRARWRTDGRLEHLGRLDGQVKLRGHRIELGEIEAVLAQHPQVLRCVVVLHDAAAQPPRLVACVVPRGPMPSASALREHLRLTLPAYMLPQNFVEIAAVPLLPNGKTDRRALSSLMATLPAPGGGADGLAAATGRGATQQAVWQVWSEVLGSTQFGIDDNFFDLGGHSLLAMALVGRLEARFARRLSLNALLQAPTVARFAQWIDAASSPFDVVLPLRPGGSGVPMFLVHDASGETLMYRSLALHLPQGVPVYALRPLAADGLTMIHTRIEAMAAHYVERIRALQPQGPYRLGGLCSGGVVAFEMALQLQRGGQQVSLLALIEATEPSLRARRGRFAMRDLRPLVRDVAGDAAHDVERDGSGLASPPQPAPPWRALVRLARRLGPLLLGQVRTRIGWAWTYVQARRLRACLERGVAPGPGLLRLTPPQIHLLAQFDYTCRDVLRADAVLFKATRGNGEADDEPLADRYRDPSFGWQRYLGGKLECIDVPGGHYTLLQEPHVATVAAALRARLERGYRPGA